MSLTKEKHDNIEWAFKFALDVITQSMRGIEERLAMLERENAELKARGE